MIAHMLSNEQSQPIVTELFIRSKKNKHIYLGLYMSTFCRLVF